MRLKLILVEPRYQINIGYIARVAKNFGVDRLYFVRPRAKITGNRAIMFAKHARELLRGAKVYGSFGDAVADCDLVVGTTGLWRKSSPTFKRIFLLSEIAGRLKRLRKDSVVGLVIGRDDTGLSSDEIEECDAIAYIGTDKDYPVLNISHALAVMLYELTKEGFASQYAEMSNRTVDRKELAFLFRSFDRLTDKKGIRDRKAVRKAFRRLVRISQPNRQEIHALITALK